MMTRSFDDTYAHVRSGGPAFYEQKRGLIAVWGKEAVQFLDGLISNDMKTLADGSQMLAAFPNAQGRLLAVVRVLRQGDKFLFDTEEATREKVFQNLFRFTFAGDFYVEDLSDNFRYFEVFKTDSDRPQSEIPTVSYDFYVFETAASDGYFIPDADADGFRRRLVLFDGLEVPDEVREIVRIENGTPLYGVDMDETTIVPELALEGLISYNKGCYIGQEIIARIHFRGHVAKSLTGVVLSDPEFEQTSDLTGAELSTAEGKNAGRITSAVYSPKLGRAIALAYVRYDYLAEGTELRVGGHAVRVSHLPFISKTVPEGAHA